MVVTLRFKFRISCMLLQISNIRLTLVLFFLCILHEYLILRKHIKTNQMYFTYF